MTLRHRRCIRRGAALLVSFGLALGLVSPADAHAAAFPVNPGPVAAGRVIIGSGQNLPPIAQSTYNVGSYMAPQVEAYYTGQAIQRDRADVTLAAWRFVRDWTRDRCGQSCGLSKTSNKLQSFRNAKVQSNEGPAEGTQAASVISIGLLPVRRRL